MRKKRYKDITGQRFGILTALSYASTDGTIARWNVRCDCGVEKTVSGQALRAGNTRSCGCLQRKRTLEYHEQRKAASDV